MPLNNSTTHPCAPTTLNTTQRLTFLINLLTLTPSQIEEVEQIAAAVSVSDLDKLEVLMTQLSESCQSLLKDYIQQAKQKAGEVQA